MRVVLAFVAAFVTAVNVYLYSQVIDLSTKVPNTTTVVVKEVERHRELSQNLALDLINATVRVVRVGLPGNGTGIVIYSQKTASRSYYHFILTAAHCIDQSAQMSIERFFYRENKYVEVTTSPLADVLFVDAESDIAVLKVWDALPFPYVPEIITEEDFKLIRLYEPVYVVGCPLGALPFVTNGNLSGVNVISKKHLAFTAPVMYGNSGGPVFTADGKLLGMVKMMARTPNGQAYPHSAFAVPAWAIAKFLKDNQLGFIAKAKDGSSFETLEKFLKEKEEREQAEREAKEAEAAKERERQEELKKALEEFMRKLKVEDPEAAPK